MKHLKLLFLFFVSTCFIPDGFSGEVKTPEPQNTIRFTENKNQWDKKIVYRAQLDGGMMFLEKNCFTYNFYDEEMMHENHIPKGRSVSEEKSSSNQENISQNKIAPIRSHAFRMTFLDAEKNVKISDKQVTPDYCNFFIGNDKSKWAGNVKNYKEVNYENLYKGINLQVLGFQNSIKYNFIIAPQENTNNLKLFYEGLDKITLVKGALKLTTSINAMVEQKPYAYQWIGNKRIDVPCEFVLENTTIHFNFPNGYDKSYELVIDPVLIFAASSGSLANNFGHTATYDEQGNLYSGGIAFDNGYPVTLGAYDTTFNGIPNPKNGITDVVITKYDASGKFLQYSTYLGGANTEIVTSLIVDAQNNLYLYGVTGSSDFPVTSNGWDQTFNGGVNYTPSYFNGNTFSNGTDIYVSKFNATGSALLASTYIGGSMNDGVNCNNNIATIFIKGIGFVNDYVLDTLQYNYGDYYRGEIDLDQAGNVVVVTSSRSNDFPIVNGFDNTLGGKQDAVVFEFNNTLSQLIWSTYLGGNNNDCANSLAIDDSSNIYVTGGTRSLDFPTTIGAKQTVYNGGITDGYITKIKHDGSAILFSTYWGTNAYDQSYFVQLDKKNNVYLFGQTKGAMPVTPGVYSNPNSGQFITKMNDSLNKIIFSTIFGNGNGIPNISPTAFLVDHCENIYVAGWACGYDNNRGPTNNMPVTLNANDPTTVGYDFYLMGLTTDASSLYYATYFGGDISSEHVHGGTSRYDKKGIVYQSLCTGCGYNQDFPGTPGSWPNNGNNWNGANCNNGVFKLDFQVPVANAAFTVNKLSGCAPLTVTFDNQSSSGTTFQWDFGDSTSLLVNPTKTYTVSGTYLVKLYIKNPASCNPNHADTAYHFVTVSPSFSTNFDFVTQPCSNQVAFKDSSAVAPVSWLWYFDDGDSATVQNPQHAYNTIGKYDVKLISSTINGCKDTAIVQVDISSAPVSISNGTTICKNNGTQLIASGGAAYSWSPTISLSNPNISNPIANPVLTTTYSVAISSVNAIGDTCVKTLSTTIKVIDPSLYSISATKDKDTLFKGQSTIIHAITDSTLVVNWSSSTGESLPNNFNLTVSPEVTTTYTVSIFNSESCVKSATITVYVVASECNPANVFVPNTFTPNDDGKNDILFVRGNEITELYFAVYNRWGQLVFETNDLNKGWNGIYKNMKADPAVFAWYLRSKCFNGGEIKKQGNVTLIR